MLPILSDNKLLAFMVLSVLLIGAAAAGDFHDFTGSSPLDGWDTYGDANWKVDGSDEAYVDGSTDNFNPLLWNKSSSSNSQIQDGWIESRTYTTTALGGARIVARLSNNVGNDDQNFYMCRPNPNSDELQLYKRLNGGWTKLDYVSQSYADGSYHTVNLSVNSNNIKCRDDGNSITASATDSDLSSGYLGLHHGADNSSGDSWDDAEVSISTNTPPTFDDVQTDPMSWQIGEEINVTANVSDDGSVSSVEADVWENGTQIVSGQSLTNNSGTWEVDSLFTVDESDVYYNMTLTATDDYGATTTYEESQFIEDNPPQVTLNDPQNKTYFKYNQTTSFSASDNDDVPEEDYNCDIEKDGNLTEEVYLKEGTNSSYTGTVRSDLGQHSVNVSCSDNAGNTDFEAVNYTVKTDEVLDVFTESPVYETENRSFNMDLKTGSMVNSADFTLEYDGSQQGSSTLDSNGVETISTVFYYEVPLVSSNQTIKNWKIDYSLNISDINNGYETQTGQTQIQNQEVLHSYSFGEHKLDNGFTQLEGSILNYTATVKQNGPVNKASINGETTYSQTSETKILDKNQLNYSETFATNLVNSSQTFNLDTEFTVNFNGDTRKITDSKNINLDNIKLSKSTGQKTLVLETRDEVNNSLQKSNIEAGFKIANPDQPSKKQFFGFDLTGKSSYNLYIQPSYAEVKMEAFQTTSLEYLNNEKNYPKRRYYFLDETLKNQSITSKLYMLQDSESTEVQFELLDEDLNPLSQHLIRVERVFPSQENTKTVTMVKTGSQGKGSTQLDTDEKYIYSIFNTEGELIQQIGPQTITDNPTTLEIEPDVEPSFANLVRDVNFDDITRNNDSLQVSYVSETERLNNISLKIYEETLFNSKLVSSDFSTDLQGVLSVSGFNASEQKLYYELTGTFGDSKLNLRTGSFGTQNNVYGDGGIFLSMLTFMVLTFSGLYRPSASIALGLISIFVLAFTGFMPVTQSALISIAALGAVMIWRMSTQS